MGREVKVGLAVGAAFVLLVGVWYFGFRGKDGAKDAAGDPVAEAGKSDGTGKPLGGPDGGGLPGTPGGGAAGLTPLPGRAGSDPLVRDRGGNLPAWTFGDNGGAPPPPPPLPGGRNPGLSGGPTGFAPGAATPGGRGPGGASRGPESPTPDNFRLPGGANPGTPGAPGAAVPGTPVARGSHVVKSGESLWAISTRYFGGPSGIKLLEAANPSVRSGNLRPGMTLVIPEAPARTASNTGTPTGTPGTQPIAPAGNGNAAPPPPPAAPGETYTVKDGDRFESILRAKYGTLAYRNQILALNRDRIGGDGSLLRPNMVLVMPAAERLRGTAPAPTAPAGPTGPSRDNATVSVRRDPAPAPSPAGRGSGSGESRFLGID